MSQGNPPRDDEVLGRLDSGPRDSSLQSGGQPNADPLTLPEGAIVALRKSGGLRFSTRMLVVYANGEVLYTSQGRGAPFQSQVLNLSEMQLLRLRRLMAHIDFAGLPQGPGKPSPDAYNYEIVVRTLGKTYALEAWDGSIPAALKSLLEQLQRVLPNE